MKFFRSIVSRKFYLLFIFSFLVVVSFSGNKFRKSNRRKPDNKNSQSENYDIRTDKSETAQETVEKFNRESGKDFSVISEQRKNIRRTADELKTSKNWNVEFNVELRNPGLIASEAGMGASFLTAARREKKSEILRRFLKRKFRAFRSRRNADQRTRNDRRLHKSERYSVIRSSHTKDQRRSRFSGRSQSRIYKARRNVSRH